MECTYTKHVIKRLALFINVTLLASTLSTNVFVDCYIFAVVSKNLNSPYFEWVRQGCEYEATQLNNSTCIYTGPEDGQSTSDTQIQQGKIVDELLEQGIDGLALAVIHETDAAKLINKVLKSGVPVITVDSDAPNSRRLAYTGTDNYEFGKELGKVLLQLKPNGGTYAIIASDEANLLRRVKGVREAFRYSDWKELPNSPTDCSGDTALALQQMEKLATENPNLGAIISVGGWPVRDIDGWKKFVDDHPTITTVVSDMTDDQTKMQSQGYVSALVGQLPFQMGRTSMDLLYSINQSRKQEKPLPFAVGEKFHTAILHGLEVPSDPPIKDMNYIGNYRILGYVLCSITMIFAIICAIWTMVFHKEKVIMEAQPKFLNMISIGTFIMASAIIPLSMDDEKYSFDACSIACMSIPWLVSIGFATILSALFSKTWSIVKVSSTNSTPQGIQVSTKLLLASYAVLLTANIVILLSWTLVAPLEYHRQPESDTDNWSRSYISYYGVCSHPIHMKGSAAPFFIPLIIINLGPLIFSAVLAYKKRQVVTDWNENHYIALVLAFMLQAWAIGLPISFLVQQNPNIYYIVMCVIIFINCLASQAFIFIPKFLLLRKSRI